MSQFKMMRRFTDRALRNILSLLLGSCLMLAGCGGDGCGSAGCGSAGVGGSGGGGTGGAPSEIRLQVEDFITGLDTPWDIAWLPNGTVLVTERPGRLNVYVDGASAEPVVIPLSDVIARGEGGLMGLEVDPSFAENGYVYICTTSSAGAEDDVRLVRLTLSRPNGENVLGREDIVTGMPYLQTGRHSGCRPRFGPDGFLWVGTGDAATGTTPQDEGSLGGKVLRLDREGAPAEGNPGGGLWYSKGHRNIQGMAFRSDGLGMSAEHGPSIDDEVNLLVPGNFGWDPVPGYNESVPMTDLEKFPDAIEAAWSSGSPTLAVSGAGFVEGDTWGPWNGALTVATLRATHLLVLFVDGDGKVTGEDRAIEDEGRLRNPRQGPDGLLYVTTDGHDGNGKVLRGTPVPVP